ncbi:MAG: rhodanese-like domain-containing protein, partial [Candidatus Hydrothermarchaeaceae archaeon]
ADHDIAKYENVLGDAGISNDKEVITYGVRGGRTDSTVLFVILDMLGHEKLRHYDGDAIGGWTSAGNDLETTEHKLPAATYKVTDKAGFDKKMVTANEALACIDDPNCVFLDTRDPPEYNGEQTAKGQRSLRGGHIPGAIQMDYIEFYRDKKGPDYKLQAYADLKAALEEKGVTKDKTVVLYCWTSTRIGEAWLALRAMGYENVRNYDHSMTEWNMLPAQRYPMIPGNPYQLAKLRGAMDKNTASIEELKTAIEDAAAAAASAQESADAAVASASEAKATGKGICGPTALLALMMLPLGAYRIYRKRD